MKTIILADINTDLRPGNEPDKVFLNMCVKTTEPTVSIHFYNKEFTTFIQAAEYIWGYIYRDSASFIDITAIMDGSGTTSAARLHISDRAKEYGIEYDMEKGTFKRTTSGDHLTSVETSGSVEPKGVPFRTPTMSGYVRDNNVIFVSEVLCSKVGASVTPPILQDLRNNIASVLSLNSTLNSLREKGLYIEE